MESIRNLPEACAQLSGEDPASFYCPSILETARQGLSPDYVQASWQEIESAQVMDIALYKYFPVHPQELI